LATRKGIIITATILAVIAAASFVVWVVPQNRGSSFVVSDYRGEIESIRERHMLIETEMESDLKELLNKTLSPDDFIVKAQTSSAQVTALITELIESNPPVGWRESYLNYDESLKKYNECLTELISLANKMKGGISPVDLKEEILKIGSLKKESDSLVEKSNETHP